MATRTVNRKTFSVDYDLDNLNQGTFVLSEFHGICDNKNDVTIDQNTFSEAENIYIDTNNTLCSRFPFKYNDNRGYTIEEWYFGEYGIRHSFKEGTEYLYCFTHELGEDNIVELTSPFEAVDGGFLKVSPVWIEDKVFFFTSINLIVFNLAGRIVNEKRLPYFEYGAPYLYIPVTKLITNGLESDLESENYLTTAYRRRYLYGGVNDLSLSDVDGKIFQVTQSNNDGSTNELYVLEGDKNYRYKLVHPESVVGTAYGLNLDSAEYVIRGKIVNNKLILIRTNLSNNLIEVSYDGGSIFYSLPVLEGLDIRFEQIFPTLTDDGLCVVAAIDKVGIAFCKVLAADSQSSQLDLVNNFVWEIENYDDILLNFTPINPQAGVLRAHNRDEWLVFFEAGIGNSSNVQTCVIGHTDDLYFSYCRDNNPTLPPYISDAAMEFRVLRKEDNFVVPGSSSVEFTEGGILMCMLDTTEGLGLSVCLGKFEGSTSTHRTIKFTYYNNKWFNTDVGAVSVPFSEIKIYPLSNEEGKVDVTVITTNLLNYDDIIRLRRVSFTDWVSINPYTCDVNFSDSEIWDESIDNTTLDTLTRYLTMNANKSQLLTSTYILNNIPSFYSNQQIIGSTAYFDKQRDYIKLYDNGKINVPVAIEGYNYYYVNDDMLWSSNKENVLLELDEYINVTYEMSGDDVNINIILNNNIPDVYAQLGEYYFAIKDVDDGQNKLLVTDTRRDDDNNFLLYLPKSNEQRFIERITNLHPLSDEIMGIFTENNIWYVRALNLDNENITRYTKAIRSKLPIGNRLNDDIVTVDDGQAIVFATPRGLAYITPQDFVATTDRKINYITDAIQNFYNDFYFEDVDWFQKKLKSMIKIVVYNYWILFYRRLDKEILLLDTRTSHWWKWKVQYPIIQITVKDNLYIQMYINMSANIVGEKYLGVSYLYCDKSYNNYFDDIYAKAYNGEYYIANTIDKQVIYKYAVPDIDWYFTSQKLHFGAIDNYKMIRSININANGEYEFAATFTTKAFRDFYHPEQYNEFRIDINDLRTFVYRKQLIHLVNFQFGLIRNSPIETLPDRLSLNSIAIRYEVKGGVR